MKGRKIAMLGMGRSAMERKIDMARYVEGAEVWSLNNAYMFYAQSGLTYARFYELHRWDYLKDWKSGADCHFTALNNLQCDVYVLQPIPIVAKQKRYPFYPLFKHFGTNYFLGSPPLMLAHACYEHDHGQEVGEIITYGFDHEDGRHAQQRQAWAYWCARAMDRGIRLTGTALNFFGETDNDEGLKGVREYFGDQLIDKAAETEP